jgi:hypothetical protein
MPEELVLRCEKCECQDLLFICGPGMAVLVCKACWHQEHRELTPELKTAIQKKMTPVDPFREK